MLTKPTLQNNLYLHILFYDFRSGNSYVKNFDIFFFIADYIRLKTVETELTVRKIL